MRAKKENHYILVQIAAQTHAFSRFILWKNSEPKQTDKGWTLHGTTIHKKKGTAAFVFDFETVLILLVRTENWLDTYEEDVG